jgi:hypothetical protein
MSGVKMKKIEECSGVVFHGSVQLLKKNDLHCLNNLYNIVLLFKLFFNANISLMNIVCVSNASYSFTAQQ